MNTHTTYFNLEAVEQEGGFPIVKICAEVALLKTRKVKSLDIEAVRQAIERVLDGEAVVYVDKGKVDPPLAKIEKRGMSEWRETSPQSIGKEMFLHLCI